MRLHRLELVNFRQHARTTIDFADGLTGIIGPNGAGKSTILEAIAWALYGNAAARGTRDTIRFTRAPKGEPVRVTLAFDLAGHRYRIVRALTSAECWIDDAPAAAATTITGVGELVQQRLGMTREEFFTTYFTGQKELDGMRSMGAAERAQFLSRVLGYERLSVARDLVRERRRALVAEMTGLRQGMPDPDVVRAAVSEAAARRQEAATVAEAAEARRAAAAGALGALAPAWAAAQGARDRAVALDAERRVIEGELAGAARDLERLAGELAQVAQARDALAPLSAELATLPAHREALRELAQQAEAEGRRLLRADSLRLLEEELARLEERRGRLASAPTLEAETAAALAAGGEALAALEQRLEAARTDWVRDRQEAETRLEDLRRQYAELKHQRDTLAALGAESPCPTCSRPLGDAWRGVLDDLEAQVETVRVDGAFYKQRVEQLRTMPEPVAALEAERRSAVEERAAQERRLARIQAGVQELAGIDRELEGKRARAATWRAELVALPAGYDAARHAALAAQVERLEAVAREAARLTATVERAAALEVARTAALAQQREGERRLAELVARRAALDWSEASFALLRAQHDAAQRAHQDAEREALAAAAGLATAGAAHEVALARRRELLRLEQRLGELAADRRQHDALERAFTDLRADLNQALRPELSELASGFLSELTDGRYQRLDLDEDYRLVVSEQGEPKPVISGGEEDLANLVLRLAISQMIAERTGQQFSLLVLDEVFGSLDDVRRQHVVALLRRLHDRFEQVIVITHIDDVRDGLDHSLLVRFDEATGAAHVEAASAPGVAWGDPAADASSSFAALDVLA